MDVSFNNQTKFYWDKKYKKGHNPTMKGTTNKKLQKRAPASEDLKILCFFPTKNFIE